MRPVRLLSRLHDKTNICEAGQGLRTSLNLLRSQGMPDMEDYHDLLTWLRTAMAITEAAYLEARRRREM
jgi:hypothetical protein